MSRRVEFEAVVDGRAVPVTVEVTPAARREAWMAHQIACSRALQDGALTDGAVERLCEEWWTRERKMKRATLKAAIRAYEDRLRAFDITPEQEGALVGRLTRHQRELFELMNEPAAIHGRGARCIAAQAEFDALVVASTFYRNGRPYFTDVAQYQLLRDRSGGHPVATRACWILSEQVLGVTEQDASSHQALFNKTVLAAGAVHVK